jgi:adenylate kinase
MLGPVHIVLLGPPGSGKGTQGKVLADHFGVPHLSTGDLLRAEVTAGTALGRRLAGVIDRGELVADELIVDVVAAALHDRGSDGYLLDGLPRTVAQAEIIERDGSPLPAPDLAVHLAIDEGVVRQRLRRRAAEQGRADDADDDVIDRRMQVYSEETEPLVDHYRRRGALVTVEGDRPVDDVTTAIVAAVEQAQPPGGG